MASAYSNEIIRAARLLVHWKQRQLAKAAKISRHTLIRIEEGGNPTIESVKKVIAVLEAKGIEFIPATETRGPGVRFIHPAGKVNPHELDEDED